MKIMALHILFVRSLINKKEENECKKLNMKLQSGQFSQAFSIIIIFVDTYVLHYVGIHNCKK